jgi:uncharacterized protein (TIGR01777 family)
MSKVLVTGATGLIGQALVRSLLERGDSVVALSRTRDRAVAQFGERIEAQAWPKPTEGPPPATALAGVDAVIHLLGEPIAQRWTAQVKQSIRDSRVLSTRHLVAALRELPVDARPAVLVSQSAAGYYGPRGDEPLDESAPAGDDFLAGVVAEWEHEAAAAEAMLRVVRTRTGVVLATGAGALSTMLPFFRLGIGGPVAGGRQYVPWIHLDDVVSGIVRCVGDGALRGPVNLAAPGAVNNGEFAKALGRALHRPAVLPVPALALKRLYGEMSTVVVTGQRVVPAALQAAGYEFAYPEIQPALDDLLSR